MPPVRIATSFAEAQEFGLPLSSTPTGKGGPSIARGQACQTCRRRKLRCDGIRPLCTACKKSALAHGDNIDFLSCKYDEYETKRTRKRTVASTSPTEETSKVAELEAEIAELKNMMARAGLGPDLGATASFVPPLPELTTSLPPMAESLPSFLSAQGSKNTAFPSFDRPMQQPSPPQSGSSHPPSSAADSPATYPSLTDLVYPGWPKDLPSPDLTSRLIEIFFTRPHAGQGMINPAKFRAAMLLSPTSPGFPHPALLHAMCAIAAIVISPDYFNTEEPYWQGSASSAGEYHFQATKLALDRAINFNSKMLQMAQANILICYFAYHNARFRELWLACGQATRKGTLLPRTDDQADLVEQATTFYGAIMADRFASGSTGWAVSLDDEDFTTPIPGLQGFPTSDVEESVLSPRNPSFYEAHPPHLVGPAQLYMKAVALLGKVVQFSHRAPHTIKNRASRLNDRKEDIRQTDAFRRLDATCASFIASIPREYQIGRRAAMGVRGDVLTEVQLCLVHSIAHSSLILLHEPHVASWEAEDEGMRKSLESADEILQAIFISLNASTEIALYSPYINYCWAVAGRTFARQIAMLELSGRPGVREMRSNVETILTVMEARKTPLGGAVAMQLRAHLDDPYRALPYGLQKAAREKAGIPEPTTIETTGCSVMDIAREEALQAAAAANRSKQDSPPFLTELGGGVVRDAPPPASYAMQDYASKIPPLDTGWESMFPAALDAGAAGANELPLSEFLHDSPMATGSGGVDELGHTPSPSSAGLSSGGSSSLFDFSSLGAAPGQAPTVEASGGGGSSVKGTMPEGVPSLWQSNGGLQAIEALLKIQQAALG
ncbi:hypothetical protein JCM8202v2_004236 [Rhodotorula sphaerocarpa]